MPATIKQINGKWRVVEAGTNNVVKNKAGTAVDGGGHATKEKARAQARAINAGSASLNKLHGSTQLRISFKEAAKGRKKLRELRNLAAETLRTMVYQAYGRTDILVRIRGRELDKILERANFALNAGVGGPPGTFVTLDSILADASKEVHNYLRKENQQLIRNARRERSRGIADKVSEISLP